MVVVPRRQPLDPALPFSPANNGLKTDQWRGIWQGTDLQNQIRNFSLASSLSATASATADGREGWGEDAFVFKRS